MKHHEKEMIAVIGLMIVVLALTMFLSGCGNMDIWDTTYTFHKAIISLPNGEVVEGKVDRWVDYESDAVQVVIGGTTYLTHYSNVVLINEKGK